MKGEGKGGMKGEQRKELTTGNLITDYLVKERVTLLETVAQTHTAEGAI